jgi:hypothetical protein
MLRLLESTAVAPLAVSFGIGVGEVAVAIGLSLGLAVGVVAGVSWWRQQRVLSDPLRSLTPPLGPLRLSQRLWMRSTTD